ncbi:MAG: hypothetical protein KDE27_12945, partial [Planctomycetes bacterium]|nr:hypothetical protein [Planctomycetota bacterium]
MRPLLATLVGLAVAVPIPTATATGQQPRFDLAPTMAFLGESVSGAIEDRDVERCAWIALAFLADGSTLRNGRYKDPLKLVIRDLRTWQDDRGRFAPGGTPCARAAQLLASLAMTECYGLSNYKLLQRNVVQAAAATLDELARAGHTALGADELALLAVLGETVRAFGFDGQADAMERLARAARGRIAVDHTRRTDAALHLTDLILGAKHPPEFTVAVAWPPAPRRDPLHAFFGAQALLRTAPTTRRAATEPLHALLAERGDRGAWSAAVATE